MELNTAHAIVKQNGQRFNCDCMWQIFCAETMEK